MSRLKARVRSQIPLVPAAPSRTELTATESLPLTVLSPTTAVLHGFDLGDRPLITSIPRLEHEIFAAESTVPLLLSQVGARVLVVFDQCELRRPIIVGVIRSFSTHAADSNAVSVQLDNERLVLSAEREIVLNCGESSITLTRAGKVVIRGESLLSHASGPNKIRGASVQIN
jgi:Domain of unknown function (DUF6484)